MLADVSKLRLLWSHRICVSCSRWVLRERIRMPWDRNRSWTQRWLISGRFLFPRWANLKIVWYHLWLESYWVVYINMAVKMRIKKSFEELGTKPHSSFHCCWWHLTAPTGLWCDSSAVSLWKRKIDPSERDSEKKLKDHLWMQRCLTV